MLHRHQYIVNRLVPLPPHTIDFTKCFHSILNGAHVVSSVAAQTFQPAVSDAAPSITSRALTACFQLHSSDDLRLVQLESVDHGEH